MTYPSTNYEHHPQDNQQLPKYDIQKLAINLGALTVLGGVVAFAVIFLVSATINAFSNQPVPELSESLFLVVCSALIGLCFGLIYLPIDGTGNEGLYKVAVGALTAVVSVVYVLYGGLLGGDWSTLKILAVFLCAAAIAIMAPARIAPAVNYA